MKKVVMHAFISQPMNGKTYAEIQDERQRIIQAMREQHGIEITYITNDFDYDPEPPARTIMLGHSIANMEESDIIIFVNGYAEAKGCRVEYSVVKEYLDYWRENGGPRVFIECLDGHIVEVEEINGDSFQSATACNYYSMLDAIRERDSLRDRVKELEDECDQQAEDNKKLSLALKDREERIDGLRKDYDILAKDYETLNEAHKGLLKEHDQVVKVRNVRIRENKSLYNDLVNAKSDLKDLYVRYDALKERYDKIEHRNESLQNELIDLREKYDNLESDYEILKNIYESNVAAFTKIFEERDKYRDELRDLGKENDKLLDKVEFYKRQANSVYGLCQPRGLYRGWIDIPYTRCDKVVIQADNGLYVSDIKYKDCEVEYGSFYTTDCKLSEVSYCVNIKDAKVYTNWPEAVCDRRQLNRMGSRYNRTSFSIKEFTF